MQLNSSYMSAAARSNLDAYVIFGVKSTHCSDFLPTVKEEARI